MSFRDYIKNLGLEAESRIESTVAKFLKTAKDSTGKKITYLDCGCDDGKKTLIRQSILMAEKTIGNEIVPERAKKARKNGIKVFSFDLNKKWGIPKNSVDVITATEVIEHLTDLDNFFAEARRVLKKKGKIIISTENLAAWHNVFALVIGNQPYTGPYLSRIYPVGHHPNAKFYKDKILMAPHLNVMTFKALLQILEKYDFKVIVKSGVSYYPLPGFLSFLMSKMDWKHSSYMLVMAESK